MYARVLCILLYRIQWAAVRTKLAFIMTPVHWQVTLLWRRLTSPFSCGTSKCGLSSCTCTA